MIRIITDSAADFEPKELEKLNITCIPLTVRFDQQEYHENLDLTKALFYELLLKGEALPQTSQASPQILLDLFEDAAKAGDDAIYFTLSSALSGTYQSAVIAAADYPGRVYVIDSLSATAGEQVLIEQAIRRRDEGWTAAQIFEELDEMSGAKVGDKTMMDALIPASEAIAAYVKTGEPMDKAGAYALQGMVELTEMLGDNANVYVDIAQDKSILKVTPHEIPAMDEEIRFFIPVENVYLFDGDTEKVIM